MTTPHPRAFVVGHPIAHSRSPLIHGYWLAEHGLPGAYERVDVHPDAFPDFIRNLAAEGWAGGNVTIPHKEAAFRLAEVLTPRAERIGAVNTLWFEDGRLHGDNTDAPGFLAHLDASLGADWPEETGVSMAGTSHGRATLVLGAGGAARAILVGLLERGLSRLIVANRSAERAGSLTALDPARITAVPWDSVPAHLPATGLLINTTALGMSGQDPLTLDLAPLPVPAAVADIVYVPLETPLLAAARARGLPAVDGLGMLLHQAVPGFSRWFGRTPAVTPALHARIVADLGGHG